MTRDWTRVLAASFDIRSLTCEIFLSMEICCTHDTVLPKRVVDKAGSNMTPKLRTGTSATVNGDTRNWQGLYAKSLQCAVVVPTAAAISTLSWDSF